MRTLKSVLVGQSTNYMQINTANLYIIVSGQEGSQKEERERLFGDWLVKGKRSPGMGMGSSKTKEDKTLNNNNAN